MDGIAVVSGGGTGIGKAVAGTFARDGRRVVIVGRRERVLRAAADEIGAGVVPLVADLTDVGQVERTAAAIRAMPDATVDVLVNNAGGPAATTGDGLAAVARGWEADFRANALSAVLLTTALTELLTSPGGRVINLTRSRRCGRAAAPTAPPRPPSWPGRTRSPPSWEGAASP
jgi:3-oxoacyl-[acyl-carrier protein] reductase